MITLDGTNGITTPDVDTDGLTVDTNTLFVDAANNRVGVGTSSPATALHVSGANATFRLDNNGQEEYSVRANTPIAGAIFHQYFNRSTSAYLDNVSQALSYQFLRNTGAEVMRIDASGNLLVGTTSILPNNLLSAKLHVLNTSTSAHGAAFKTNATSGFAAAAFSRDGNNGGVCEFLYNPSTTVGSISVTSSATSYNTSSDYRLKEDVQPMVGSVDRLMALKPVNFAWKVDGSRVDGFLAHEAQEVVPESVTGEKDAVDDEGNPQYQGIDQSKIVPLLVAALQEALTKIEALEARVAALETNA